MARVDHGAIYRKGAETVLTEQRATQLAARTLTLGAYERISDDQEDEYTGDRGAGASRQHEALQLLCTMLSSSSPSTWSIHRHYSDNDVSAYKDVVRPEFELLLRDLDNGVIEGIVVYDLDRLARRPKDLERVIDIYDKASKSGRTLRFATVHDRIGRSGRCWCAGTSTTPWTPRPPSCCSGRPDPSSAPADSARPTGAMRSGSGMPATG